MLRAPRYLIFTALLLLGLPFRAQPGLRFVENKGQWPKDVFFRSEIPGATVWCEADGVVLDLYDAKRISEPHANVGFDAAHADPLQHHAVRLRFLSATSSNRINGGPPLPGHHNYFIGSDRSRWAGNARAFATVDLVEVAPGCDARFRMGHSGLKYDLTLAPGADPALIRFTYDGADELRLRNGVLIVSTSLGRLTERIPLAYQDVDGGRRIVACTYTLKNGIIGVEPGEYDPRSPLVIDPTLAFATYSGSFSNNFGYSATFDDAGFLYAGSTAFGTAFPVTMGAYQTSWAGGVGQGTIPGTDIAITKYDTTGSFLIWSTYLGGASDEMPHSLIVDGNGEVLVLGTTGSSDFPVTSGAYDGSFEGGSSFAPSGLGLSYPAGSDMILARLSNDGSDLLGSTFIGGTGNDGLNSAPALKFNYADEVRGEVLLDTAGNVWVVSCSQSMDLSTTGDAAQPSFAGGSHDGYVARLDPALTQLQYASYIGGSGADALYAGELDEAGRLFITGGTNSLDLQTTSAAVSTSFNGGAADAFVGRVVPGIGIEAMSYWGSDAYDQSYFVELDDAGSVYLFGQTSAPAGQLISNAPYNVPSGGQFITKLDHELANVLISSRIGSGDGTPDISPTAFLVDVCDKIYTSGWGSSAGGLGGTLTTAGLPVTSAAHQSTTDGHDLYLAVFDINMNGLSYATYYGGAVSPEHVDGGTSRFDRRGRVYQSVCAGCQNNDDFPTSPGAWSATNNSTGCNNGVLKFDFDAPLVIAAFTAPDPICAGASVSFTNLSSGATGHFWEFGDGSTSTSTSPTHTYSEPGTYVVRLTSSDPNSCNGQDIAVRTIVIEPDAPAVIAMNDTLICGPNIALIVGAQGFGTATNYVWSTSNTFNDTLNAPELDSAFVLSPIVAGTYHVRASNGSICAATDSVVISTSLVNALVQGDTTICAQDTAQLFLLGIDPGSSIDWMPNDEILIGQGTTNATIAPDASTVYAVNVVSQSGCTWSSTIGVEVSPLVGSTVNATVDQGIVSPGTTVQLSAWPSDGVNYGWSPAGSVSDPISRTPTATVNSTTTFTVTVSDGICTREASVTVEVRELLCEDPDIFVPNTFTPNGDGNNDVLLVRGRSISELEFMVFDRWGEKVFETYDQSRGWDGTFQGIPVDPAVFVYHLTVYCVDGQHFFTKGNVTVVR
ncbi:MAG: gliding motility-associated C-terminal domain-containing protein [Flavobacteriales bacterium]|nr:gliding motility-associated C-terminal domain-containing protein [Flavobacteriales bacterium]